MTYHHQRRLRRALHHLECLESVVDAWLEENPCRTWSEPEADSTKKLLWVEVLKPPPTAELSLIIGDFLHNLRSALDNLAFELALAYKGEPMSKSIEGDSAFPVLRTCSDHNLKELNRMLRGIDPDAKTVIQGLQPYNRGERRAINDPLWQLNELSREDKHRLPHVTPFASISHLSFRVSGGPGADEIEPITFTVEDRASIARYPAVDQTGAEVDVNLTPTFSVGFGQRAPQQLRGFSAPDRLAHIHRYIADKVVSPLAPYLD